MMKCHGWQAGASQEWEIFPEHCESDYAQHVSESSAEVWNFDELMSFHT